MLDQGLSLVKALIKSSLDNYVLPGTLTGTEIMLLYLSQWRRNLVVVSLAVLYLASAQFERAKLSEPLSSDGVESLTSK